MRFRADAEQGDLQVNLVGKDARAEKSHAIAQRVIERLRPIAERRRPLGWSRCPRPPVLSPIVAEVYGPDGDGRAELARRLYRSFTELPGMVAADTTLRDGAVRQRRSSTGPGPALGSAMPRWRRRPGWPWTGSRRPICTMARRGARCRCA
ncbi:MAG: hypothetical protein R3E68_14025 [Burkholderiaceae bacterium]